MRHATQHSHLMALHSQKVLALPACPAAARGPIPRRSCGQPGVTGTRPPSGAPLWVSALRGHFLKKSYLVAILNFYSMRSPVWRLR